MGLPHDNGHPDGTNDRSDSGMALFVVLAFLLLVAAVITPFAVSAHVEAMVTRNTLRETRDRFAIEGVTRLAAAAYLRTAEEIASRPTAQMPARVQCDDAGGAAVTLNFINHAGLIDLNMAPPDLLEAGFRALGMSMAEAGGYAKAVVKARTPPPAKDGEEAADATLETVFQLADLTAFGEPIGKKTAYGPARGVFTVYSQLATVDVSVSPPPLAKLLRRFGVEKTDFIVEGEGRTPALTVEAVVSRPNQPVMRAAGVYAAGLRALEPLRLSRGGIPGDAQAGDAPQPGECGQVMGGDTRRAMFEVLS